MQIGGVGGVYRGPKTVQLMGLDLKVTVPLGFLAFLRGSVRLRAQLELLTDSRNSWGFGGGPGSYKRLELMGLGLKATVPLGFFSFLRGLVRLKSILRQLADFRKLWGFRGGPGVRKGWK